MQKLRQYSQRKGRRLMHPRRKEKKKRGSCGRRRRVLPPGTAHTSFAESLHSSSSQAPLTWSATVCMNSWLHSLHMQGMSRRGAAPAPASAGAESAMVPTAAAADSEVENAFLADTCLRDARTAAARMRCGAQTQRAEPAAKRDAATRGTMERCIARKNVHAFPSPIHPFPAITPSPPSHKKSCDCP